VLVLLLPSPSLWGYPWCVENLKVAGEEHAAGSHEPLELSGITASGIKNLAAWAGALGVPVVKHLPACKLYERAPKQQPCFVVGLAEGCMEVLPVCDGCGGH
jgi:hypothetical protein